MKKLHVALVGLGFGGAFAPIYKEHPNVGKLTLFDTNPAVIKDFHHSPAFVAAFARRSRINYLNTADIGLQGSMGMSE